MLSNFLTPSANFVFSRFLFLASFLDLFSLPVLLSVGLLLPNLLMIKLFIS